MIWLNSHFTGRSNILTIFLSIFWTIYQRIFGHISLDDMHSGIAHTGIIFQSIFVTKFFTIFVTIFQRIFGQISLVDRLHTGIAEEVGSAPLSHFSQYL